MFKISCLLAFHYLLKGIDDDLLKTVQGFFYMALNWNYCIYNSYNIDLPGDALVNLWYLYSQK